MVSRSGAQRPRHFRWRRESEEPSVRAEREEGMAEQRQKQRRELSQVGKPVSGVCNPKDKVTGGRGDPGMGEKEAEIQGDGEQRKTTEKALWKVKEGSGVSRNSYKERKREKGRLRGEERGDTQERTTVERNRRS